jgi:hypothetical protein
MITPEVSVAEDRNRLLSRIQSEFPHPIAATLSGRISKDMAE